VLSKIALQIVETVRFKHCADADRFVRKGAMLLSGVADGKQFQLVAAHCQANDDRRWERSTQMQQLRDELIFPFQSESIPQFICADMNVPVQKLGEYDLMLELLDATDTPLSGPTRFTYDGFHNTIVQSLGYRSEHTTYDYILLRENKAGIKNIRKSIQVFRHEGKDLSDHYALLCEIDW
jgi:endonuclease/exonuclease/phosphatase family metal-dependent hydrolase